MWRKIRWQAGAHPQAQSPLLRPELVAHVKRPRKERSRELVATGGDVGKKKGKKEIELRWSAASGEYLICGSRMYREWLHGSLRNCCSLYRWIVVNTTPIVCSCQGGARELCGRARDARWIMRATDGSKTKRCNGGWTKGRGGYDAQKNCCLYVLFR